MGLNKQVELATDPVSTPSSLTSELVAMVVRPNNCIQEFAHGEPGRRGMLRGSKFIISKLVWEDLLPFPFILYF